jgi:hypothetical protein
MKETYGGMERKRRIPDHVANQEHIIIGAPAFDYARGQMGTIGWGHTDRNFDALSKKAKETHFQTNPHHLRALDRAGESSFIDFLAQKSAQTKKNRLDYNHP